MEYPNLGELLKDNGWKTIGTSVYEKKNRGGYTFQVYLDKDTEEWWCHIDDERHCSCGDIYLPSYRTLESIVWCYGN